MSELQLVSRILAVRLARLGDITLMLPSLRLLKSAFPDASITVLTGLPYEPLLRLCPWVDEVISIDRIQMRDGPRTQALSAALRLVKELRSNKFDLVLDFHGFRETSLMVWLSGGRYRIGLKRVNGTYLRFCFNLPPAVQDESWHVADMFPRIVRQLPGLQDVDVESGPTIRIPEGASSPRTGMTVALYVGASAPSRRWPGERFAALALHLVDDWGASVRVLSGLTAEEQAVAAAVALRADRKRKIQVLQALSIPEMVKTLAVSDILISNDSGPMHVGSALGVPTLGIFSESPPHHYRPVGPKDRFIHREKVEDVQVPDVVRILEEMRSTGLR